MQRRITGLCAFLVLLRRSRGAVLEPRLVGEETEQFHHESVVNYPIRTYPVNPKSPASDAYVPDSLYLVDSETGNVRIELPRRLLQGFSMNHICNGNDEMEYPRPDTPPDSVMEEPDHCTELRRRFGNSLDKSLAAWNKEAREPDSVRFLPLPRKIIRQADLVFLMASVPRYVKDNGISSSLDGVADILSSFGNFVLDTSVSVSDPGRNGRRISKWLCFKENLRDLIYGSSGVAHELGIVLRRLAEKEARMHTSGFPTQLHPRSTDEKIEKLLAAQEFAPIRWYLHVSLASLFPGFSAHASYVDSLDRKNSVKVAFLEPRGEKGAKDLLWEFVSRQSLLRVESLSIEIEEGVSVETSVFDAVLEIFPEVYDVIFVSLGDQSELQRNSALVEHVLARSRIQSGLGYGTPLLGLVMGHVFALSPGSLSELQDASLARFGFLSYYPESYFLDSAFTEREARIGQFLDALLLGRMPLATSIRHIVAPDTFFFTDISSVRSLPFLETLEVYIRQKDWTRRKIRADLSLFVKYSTGIRALILVDPGYRDEVHAVHMLGHFVSLGSLERIDVSRSRISASHLSDALLRDAGPRKKEKMKALAFTYYAAEMVRGSAEQETSQILSGVLREYTQIKRINVYFDGSSLQKVLPYFVHDVQHFLTYKEIQVSEVSRIIRLGNLKRTYVFTRPSFITRHIQLPRSLVRQAFFFSHGKPRGGITFEELFQCLEPAPEPDSGPRRGF